MSQDLVGTKTVASVEELRSLLSEFAPDCCYFGRWAHKVSGLVRSIDTVLPSPEGQMFCPECEVRWQQQPDRSYTVLLLHGDRSVTDWGFEPVGNGWQVSAPLAAYQYTAEETRFPQGFHNPDRIGLQQRYVRDLETATVRFVALTLAPN